MDASDSDISIKDFESGGPTLKIISWLLLVVIFLAICSRLVTKWFVSRKFNHDDLFLVIAFIFALGNGASISIEGSHNDPLITSNEQKFEELQKARYAANLCFISALYFTRLSSTMFLRIITPDNVHQLISLYYIYFTSIWAFVCLVTSAFQCSPPQVWRSNTNGCFDQYIFWTAVLVMEILLHIVLTIVPFHMMWNLRVRKAQKFAILCCFGSRICIIAGLIVQAIFMHQAQSSRGPIPDSWISTMISQIVICLSFIVPCLPYLKPFLESLNSGFLGVGAYEETLYGGSTAQGKVYKIGNLTVDLQNLNVKSKMSTSATAVPEESMFRNRDTSGVLTTAPSLESHTSHAKMIKVRTSLDWEEIHENGQNK